MNAETRSCQNCKVQFTIEPADFEFYNRIAVPPPTWCPTCRMVRKMAYGLDATTLYARQCQAPGHTEKVFSCYPEGAPVVVYDYLYWRSDAWDPLSYGKEYDFNLPFFEQLNELSKKVPVRNVELVNSTGCDYCPTATDSKNCYLSSGQFCSENCLYSHSGGFSKECVDNSLGLFDEQVYSCFSVDKSFRTTYATYSDELVNCDFMYDCRGSSDCLGCVGLRSKKYCIFNKQYSKEEYKVERAKYDLGSYSVREEVARRYHELILQRPRKYAIIRNAPGCTGDNIMNSKDSQFTFQALDDVENCKYILVAGRGMKECYDVAGAGLKCALMYEVISSVSCQRLFFSRRVNNSHDIYYSRECKDSSYLFGCIGLTSKKYCVLNRQYSKAEYEILVPKIIAHMEEMKYKSPRGQVYGFGEFFPIEHSPLAYNSSWADEYFPLSKEVAVAQGHKWRDLEVKEHKTTLTAGQLPDHIAEAPDSLSGEIIGCAHTGQCGHPCTRAFKIIPVELAFYKKFNIALPRLCPACRYREMLTQLTPYQLWTRKCECVGVEQRTGYQNTGKHTHGNHPCSNEFKTAYAPGRPELLYCEECYNKEIL